MSGYAGSQRPRQAILGQLPRIYRADGSPIRVLLVDDEPALTNLVKMALHYEGWVVEIAHNGREALAKFDRVDPRRAGPRHHASRHGWPAHSAANPRIRRLHPHALPDRPRFGHGPGHRSDRRRRRLHDQAVQPRGIGRPAARIAAPLQPAVPTGRRSTQGRRSSDSTPPAAKSTATVRRYRCRRPSSNCCASSCAIRAVH